MGQQTFELDVAEATRREGVKAGYTCSHPAPTPQNVGQLSVKGRRPSSSPQKKLSDKEVLKALYETPLDELPLLSVREQRSRGQGALGFSPIINDVNAATSEDASPLRAERAIHALHENLIKVSAEHLLDGRVSSHVRADSARWFMEKDQPFPHWQTFSFETCCRLVGADPDMLRTALFSMVREVRNYDGKDAIPDDEMERMIRRAIRASLTLADVSH